MIASGAMIDVDAERPAPRVVRREEAADHRARIAAATPAVAPHAANAVARSRPWNVLDRIARVHGSISDAPMPSMIASPMTSSGTPLDTDAMNEPKPKSAAPMMKMRRWP